ncbi:SusC/RagA family TonB-linked outer membrane protein [Ekhidna sp.]|uniref:SusC/RagA family TonB-linked outer membrane protein n=1 Tax=Ekhidna sp. TaxID=2608089 RepID=UPI003B58F36B
MKKFYFSLFACLLAITQVFAQRTVSGKVTDDVGESLPGVNVVIKGTTTGTTTDLDGNYRLQVNDGDILVYSFVGFKSQEINVGTRSVIDVTMGGATELQEVVVTGYGPIETRRASGAVASVDAKTINNVPMASFDKILQGQAAGVLSQSNSGQPGAGASVLIRGAGSINSSTQPLYILDGVPIDAAEFETLNPNDISNISVLKDASSSAIYGSRGANGVIVITSKSGQSGKPKVTFSAQYGVSEAPKNFLPVMNTNQKIDFELLTGGTTLSTYTAEQIDSLRQFETSWKDELFETAVTRNYQINVSGGNENTTYFISGSYYDEDGAVVTTGLKRYTARVNLKTVTGNLTFGTNNTLGYSRLRDTNEGDQFIGSPLNAAYWSNPYEPVFNPDGTYNQLVSGQPNGVQELVQNTNITENVKIISSLYGEFDIPGVDGLSVNSRWGVDFDSDIDSDFTDPRTNPGAQAKGGQGSLFRDFDRDVTLIGTNSINYVTDFGSDHRLSVSLFQEFIWNDTESFNYTGYGFTNLKLKNDAGVTQGSATNGFIPDVGGGGVRSSLLSYFGTVAYTFMDKYTFNGTLRRDGSSRFGSNNRYATFYSAGVAWIVSDESFFNVGFVDNLKFKASYGTTGNQEIGDFQYAATLGTVSYAGENGLALLSIPNPSIQWETTKMLNVGLEFSMIQSRLSGTIEYYDNLTVDAFLNTQLSRTTGFAAQNQNAGEVRNSGVEVSLSGRLVDADDFSVVLGANFAYNENVVESLAGEDDIVGNTTIIREGEPVSANYVVPYLGVNPANGDALYLTADGRITNVFDQANDSRVYGPRTAPYSGGVTLNVTYGNLSLFALGSWIQGSTLYNNERINIDNPAYVPDNVSTDLLRAWKQPGDITDVPRIRTVDGLTTNTYQSATTRYLEDGDFFRLRNVVLAYNLPTNLISKAGFKNVRFYAQGQNLITLTKFTGADPEDTNGFLAGAVYPAVRTYTFGLDLTF